MNMPSLAPEAKQSLPGGCAEAGMAMHTVQLPHKAHGPRWSMEEADAGEL